MENKKTEENAKDLEKVIGASELGAVHLKSSSSNCHVYPTLIVPSNCHINIDFSAEWSLSENKDALFCVVNLFLKANAVADASQIKAGMDLFDIKLSLVLAYHMSVSDLKSSAIDMFVSRNALFNAYPFFREMVATFTSRMGLESMMLPLMKPGTSVAVNNASISTQV